MTGVPKTKVRDGDDDDVSNMHNRVGLHMNMRTVFLSMSEGTSAICMSFVVLNHHNINDKVGSNANYARSLLSISSICLSHQYDSL